MKTRQSTSRVSRIVGDIDFHAASLRAGWVTPVPGGVGPLTVAMLFSNTLNSALWRLGLSLFSPLLHIGSMKS
ncbi:unnamed protein product [Protopolystoma xenopodis]|uniref:Tetrahydrofolate dehydrogenase/cyclohydrolase NAD(P)-binding domain-containing protein n=1 Tax=Protopolystoma xenopodis TaxID=117903 RepID=A0A448XRP9_9PLAT|nr:unnamed protein product [Protopolystoma xenopodis]